MMKQLINEMNREIQETGQISGKARLLKYSLLLVFLLTIGIPTITFSAPPAPPVGLCFQTPDGSIQCAANTPFVTPPTTGQTSVFPGTNLKIRPGFVISAYENQSLSLTESKWQELFTSAQNRKVSYRPPGVYGGIVRRLDWYRLYTNQNVRPKNPQDHRDPAYDWSLLDSIFTINAVQNESALIMIAVRDIGWGGKAAPNWLATSPYDGVFSDGASGGERYIPKYYRFTGPDLRGQTNVGASPPIVEEYIAFHQAMYDHLVSTGNIDKVMGVDLEELFAGPTFPSDWNVTDYFNGAGLRSKQISEIWEASGIPVYQRSVAGGSTMKSILWRYVSDSSLGLGFPDLKMTDTSDNIGSRFTDTNGVYQKDIRPLIEATESNGLREFTYFAPGIANPWNYSNVTLPQTASHILWALSGPPKGVNKNSGLGQNGEDPPGVMPVHTVILSWDASSKPYEPTIEDWHSAIDTFGPPGTFAFPYLPPGYKP